MSEFLEAASGPIGGFYLAAAAVNAVAAFRAGIHRRWPNLAAWGAVAILFALCAAWSFAGRPPELPAALKAAFDAALGPIALLAGSAVALAVFYRWRRLFVVPAVAFGIFNISLFWLGASLADRHFAAIVARPDNLPIVGMVYLLAFFTWLSTARAVANDDRLARGEPPLEAADTAKVLTWPDAVYLELIGLVAILAALIVWALLVPAPLEEPANPAMTPNPSKAPWYFVGLQELLVYFAPWLAGVVLPLLIVLGLMAIPYLDVNPKGNGYYTIRERWRELAVFQSGFLLLWILLILIGTFLRGPNWSFYGPYEYHDPVKVAPQHHVRLSEWLWVDLLERSVPQVQPGAGFFAEWGTILYREAAGLLLLAAYFAGIPFLLSRYGLRSVYRRMGTGRYTILILLLLMMLMLPIKMLLAWTLDLSYLVSIPEYLFYF